MYLASLLLRWLTYHLKAFLHWPLLDLSTRPADSQDEETLGALYLAGSLLVKMYEEYADNTAPEALRVAVKLRTFVGRQLQLWTSIYNHSRGEHQRGHSSLAADQSCRIIKKIHYVWDAFLRRSIPHRLDIIIDPKNGIAVKALHTKRFGP